MVAETTGYCRLCLRLSELRNSHIIPEFVYKPLYDSRHRFFRLSTEPQQKTTFVQKGLRERLLCEGCEQHLSAYERYASRILPFQVVTDSEKNRHRSDVVVRVDYGLMKLFQLSILWRASVSKLPDFSQVGLGPDEETLRVMLLNGKPGAAQEYGCLITSVMMDDQKLADGLVDPPFRVTNGGFTHYVFVFGGFVWVFVGAGSSPPFPFEQYFLQEDGILTIHKSKFEEVSFLMDSFREMKRRGKLENGDEST